METVKIEVPVLRDSDNRISCCIQFHVGYTVSCQLFQFSDETCARDCDIHENVNTTANAAFVPKYESSCPIVQALAERKV